MSKILIIDDEISICNLLSSFLHKNGYTVTTAHSGKTAFRLLAEYSFNLILCDYRLEDTNGKSILLKVKEKYPDTIVIMVTGYSNIKTAVELIKLGAYDYITKPVYPEELLATIVRALKHQTNASAAITQMVNHQLINDHYIRGESTAAMELEKQIKLVAPTPYSVILTGENGTGKECVARAIHDHSLRSHQPFVAMDCGSLTKDLASSEFFGHEKGAFTGAIYTKIGHFEQANGGTLFLDEIGNLSYEIQASLLRTVQERQLKRIGSTREIELDIRLIVATNANLKDHIKAGTFREDLYHRFNEFSIHLPPLRKRGKDILIFASQFLDMVNREQDRRVKDYSPAVKNCFLNYSWPGNIRELKNVVRRAVLLTTTEEVQIDALPLEISMVNDDRQTDLNAERNQMLNLKHIAKSAEYETILSVLKKANNNKTKAAQLLNIDRKTLYNKIKKLKPDIR